MNSRKTNILFSVILLITLLLLSSSTLALSEDFDAFSSSSTSNQCACSVEQRTVLIKNTGDIGSKYFFSQEGEAAKWANVAPDELVLEPGEQKEINIFIAAPCEARGEFELDTKITTLIGTEKIIKQSVKVDNCPNVQITQKTNPTAICPSDPAEYKFEIYNTGQHTESYRLSVKPFPEYVTLSDDVIILEPGQRKIVSAFITLPAYVYGAQTFTLSALAENAAILGELDFDLLIDKCYDYELVLNPEYSVCQYQKLEVPVIVNNTAKIGNEYELNVIGPIWADITSEPLFAWGLGNEVANLTFSPKAGDLGTHNITITSLSKRGDEGRAANTSVFVENCFDYEIILEDYQKTALTCSSQEYGFLLNNLGTKELTLAPYVEGPDWIYFDNNQTITLPPQSNYELRIPAEIPCEEGEATIDIGVNLIDSIDKFRGDEIQLDIKNPEKAYMIDMPVNTIELDYSGAELEFNITHTGTLSAVYDLSLFASPWVTLQENVITLAPGETKTVHMTMYPDGKVVPPGAYFAQINASVRGSDVVYSKDFNVELASTPIWMKLLRFLGNNLVYVILGIFTFLILIGLFALLIKNRNTDEELTETKNSKTEKPLIENLKKRDDSDKPKSKWLVFLLLGILVLGLTGAGIYLAMTLTGGHSGLTDNETVSADSVVKDTTVIEEPEDTVLTEDDISEALMIINRSGILGEGNNLVVEDGTEFVLPVTVTNPTTKKATFTINIEQESSWINVDKTEIIIPYGSKRTVDLTITPDMNLLKENDYSISIEGSIVGEEIEYKEALDLRISKKKSILEGYPFWIIVGMLVLIPLLILLALISREKSSDNNFLEVKSKKHKFEKSNEEKSKILPIILITIATLFLISGLVVAGIIVKNSLDNKVLELEDTAVVEAPELTESVNENVSMPTSINNSTNKEANFKNHAEAETDWISAEKDFVNSYLFYLLLGIVAVVLVIAVSELLKKRNSNGLKISNGADTSLIKEVKKKPVPKTPKKRTKISLSKK